MKEYRRFYYGFCERACPQHLPITTHLKDVAEKLEKNSIIPTRK